MNIRLISEPTQDGGKRRFAYETQQEILILACLLSCKPKVERDNIKTGLCNGDLITLISLELDSLNIKLC
jgi:hypothetical protein